MAPTTRSARNEKPKANTKSKNPKVNTKTKKLQATTSEKASKSKKKTDVVPILGEEVSSEIDAILLMDVLKRNGEERLYDEIMALSDGAEDDPPLIFDWENVEGFVQAIQAAQAQAAAPGGLPLPESPFAFPVAVTVKNFKAAVLECARAQGAPAPIGAVCLPCSLAQSLRVLHVLGKLEVEPWIQRIIAVGVPNSLPIACVYVPRPRTNTLDRAAEQFPNSVWG